MGSISAYSFSSIGQACKLHNVTTFYDAWYVRMCFPLPQVQVTVVSVGYSVRAKSVGPKSAYLISFIITFKTFFACLAYSIIIGTDIHCSFQQSVEVMLLLYKAIPSRTYSHPWGSQGR